MLAQLNSISGVAASYVEITGRFFLVKIEPRRPAAEITLRVLDLLGADTCLLENPWKQEELSDFENGELWLGTESLLTLSLLEARILSARWGKAAAADARLGTEAIMHFEVLLRSELAHEFRRMHKEGGTGERNWYRNAFQCAFDRSIARFDGAKTPAQTESMRVSLLRSLEMSSI